MTIYINNLVEQIAMISLIMGSYILKILLMELSKTTLKKEFSSAAIMKLKPAAAKGTYIKSIYLSSTMSKGVKVDPKAIEEAAK